MTTNHQAHKRSTIIQTLVAMYTPGSEDIHRQKRHEVKRTILDMLASDPDDFDWAIRRCFDFKRDAYHQSVNDRNQEKARAEYTAAYAAWQEFTPLIYYHRATSENPWPLDTGMKEVFLLGRDRWGLTCMDKACIM